PHLVGKRGAAEELPDHLGRVLLGQRFEHEPGRGTRAAPAGLAIEEVGPSRTEQEHWPLDALDEVLDEPEERFLGPVDVVDLDDQRRRPAERLEQLARAPVDLVERELLVGEADRRGDAVADVGRRRNERLELREPGRRRVGVVDTGRVAYELDERPEGDAAAVREAAAAEHARLAPVNFEELACQAGLPDAWLADHGREAAST